MYIAPPNWIDTSNVPDPEQVRDSSADKGDVFAAFALVYKEVLDIAKQQNSNSLDELGNEWPGATSIQSSSAMADVETWRRFPFAFQSTPIDAGATENRVDGRNYKAETNYASLGTPSYSSSMGRFMSQTGAVQSGAGVGGNAETPLISAGVLSKTQLVSWMDAHALTQSSHHCAMYCRMGMEAAGISTGDRPHSGDAGDYGPFLLRHGAQVVSPNSYIPLVGDTAVFDKTEKHPSGHIEIFDGRQWVSDFKQHSFSPYRDSSSTPPFTIYRLA